MRICTQADIARELGVSQTAVCLALGNARSARRTRLSNEMHQKIRAKALEMGYHISRTKRVLRTGRTTSITILNFGEFSEPSAQRTYEVGRLANEAGFNFDVVDAYWHHDDMDRVVDGILNTRPLAVIVAGNAQPNFPTKQLISAGIHVVAIGMPVQGCPWVRYDARAAICEITETMIQAGRRRLALMVKDVGDGTPSWQLKERHQGFINAVTKVGAKVREYHGKEIDFGFAKKSSRTEAIIVTTPSLDDFYAIPELTNRLMASRIRPDMLVCSNDHFAIGAMSICYQQAAQIPEEIGLSGFDNIILSAHVVVPLTTVKQPIKEMCSAAIEIIKKKIRQPARLSTVEEEHVFPCKIIWRDSTPSTK